MGINCNLYNNKYIFQNVFSICIGQYKCITPENVKNKIIKLFNWKRLYFKLNKDFHFVTNLYSVLTIAYMYSH